MLQVLCLDTMTCVKEDGSCMDDYEESGSGDSGSGDFGSGDFGPGDDHHIVCHEGTVSFLILCLISYEQLTYIATLPSLYTSYSMLFTSFMLYCAHYTMTIKFIPVVSMTFHNL